MSAARTRLRVVVDGSNLATEGRSDPSLGQLDEALDAFRDENPRAEVIVVVDASFGHRVASGERGRFKQREMDGTIVTPPAGAIGRGDAFILKIADRINGVVLSNDSFQEFHSTYPWLFDEGRLIGGKPVPGVGWVFTPRLPVRGVKSVRATKKLAVVLHEGATPAIGTTITPVKRATPSDKPERAKKTVATTAKVAKRSSKTIGATPDATPPAVAPPKRASRTTKVVAKKAKATSSAPSRTTTTRVAERPGMVRKSVGSPAAAKRPTPSPPRRSPSAELATAPPPSASTAAPLSTSAVALRRGRQPVNPEAAFAKFRSAFKVGARFEGEVTTFTSHGAVISVSVKGAVVECYAPTTLLGDPPPARARDVLKRGDRRNFRLITVDSERRIAELALL